MKKPNIVCPAGELHQKVTSDEYVVICKIVMAENEKGESNFPNYTIIPSHCEEYTKCLVWREQKDKDWVKKYSSLEQAEGIRV